MARTKIVPQVRNRARIAQHSKSNDQAKKPRLPSSSSDDSEATDCDNFSINTPSTSRKPELAASNEPTASKQTESTFAGKK